MDKVGIDTLAIYTSRYALDLSVLATARGVDPDKFRIGLGQKMMSVPAPGEDIVTMAASAANEALRDINLNDIEMLLFATESGIDQSKAAGLYLHKLLNLPSRCRVVELKQACYSGTAALQLANCYLQIHPHKKVLVVASDIARYGLGTPGESSQGCGATAMVLSVNPRLLAIEPEFGVLAEDVMDFWRPNYLHEALVDGKYSSKLYLTMLEKSWQQYQALSSRQLQEHDYFCYHIPVPRLAEKAHQHLLKISDCTVSQEECVKQAGRALEYGRNIGNSYTASLYIGLASLLDLANEELSHKRIGFYSYGSGCVAEYFSGIVQPHYRTVLRTDYHRALLAQRTMLTYEQYESFYQFRYVEDGSHQIIPPHQTGLYRLVSLNQHKRCYEKVAPTLAAKPTGMKAKPTNTKDLQAQETTKCVNKIKVFAPGKLILSGEHAVVYGKPSLAMAVNRYASATVTHEVRPQVLFDLADLSHHSRLSFNALQHLKNRIKHKYHRFIRGDFSIREVLQKPFELAQYALGILADAMNLSLPHGVKLHVQSDIPIGCGMGSSAATILSVMHAIYNFLDKPISKEELFRLALEAENMQHGRSSGLDLRVALQGGCIYMEEDIIHHRNVPDMPMYLVNTGSPVTTTGQCVEKVAPFFKSTQLQDEFAAVTKAMDQALRQQSWQAMQSAIKANHQLLVNIGVVPEKVQHFIKEVEAVHGAAKVCGSGAVIGQRAGAVLVALEDKTALMTLCTQIGYNVVPIAGEMRGVHAA